MTGPISRLEFFSPREANCTSRCASPPGRPKGGPNFSAQFGPICVKHRQVVPAAARISLVHPALAHGRNRKEEMSEGRQSSFGRPGKGTLNKWPSVSCLASHRTCLACLHTMLAAWVCSKHRKWQSGKSTAFSRTRFAGKLPDLENKTNLRALILFKQTSQLPSTLLGPPTPTTSIGSFLADDGT